MTSKPERDLARILWTRVTGDGELAAMLEGIAYRRIVAGCSGQQWLVCGSMTVEDI